MTVKNIDNRSSLFFLNYFLVLAVTVLSYSTDSHAISFRTGSASPDFTAKNFFTGEEINYGKNLKGNKVVMLNFWSVYCVSCEKEVPKVIDLYNRYKEKGLYVLSINLDTSSIRLKYYYKDPSKVPPYVTILDNTRIIGGLFHVSILPTTIIIDKKGKIALYHVGYKPGDEKHIEDVIMELTE